MTGPTPRGTRTREALLAATMAVIRRIGLARTTTREIARAAGYSEATLYKHFPSKEDLFLAVLNERIRPFRQLVVDLTGQAGERSVKRQLDEFVIEMMDVFEDATPVAMAVFADPILMERQRSDLLSGKGGPHKANELLAEYLRREQKLGRVAREANPAAVANMLVGACFQRAYFTAFLGRDVITQPDERFAKDLVREAMRLLA